MYTQENEGVCSCIYTEPCTQVVHGCIIYNSQCRNNQMSISRWFDELNMVYPSNGILFNHKKEWILTPATTWMILENMLNERSRSAKATHFMIPLMSDVQNRQIQMTGCWGRGRIRGWPFWFEVSVWGDEMFSSWLCRWLYNSEYTQTPFSCTL